MPESRYTREDIRAPRLIATIYDSDIVCRNEELKVNKIIFVAFAILLALKVLSYTKTHKILGASCGCSSGMMFLSNEFNSLDHNFAEQISMILWL